MSFYLKFIIASGMAVDFLIFACAEAGAVVHFCIVNMCHRFSSGVGVLGSVYLGLFEFIRVYFDLPIFL